MDEFERPDGRAADELRSVRLRRSYLEFAEGSCLVEFGRTRVLCAASVEEGVPPFLKGSGRGWVTAEYSMLPRATPTRSRREVSVGRPSGRSQEIQRLIGRSLRSVTDLAALGEVTITVDCDCLVADGGTRTAAITGAYVALADAVTWMREQRLAENDPLRDAVAAVSVGVVGGTPVLDLCYEEDSRAEVDMNVVMTGSGAYVEVQGTAEHEPFDREALEALLDIAGRGIVRLVDLQRQVLGKDRS